MKPYRKIIRPFELPSGDYVNDSMDKWYLIDFDYAPDRISLIRAYSILEKDLVKILEYIEPNDDNLNTYSHRLYEILLRACTEFETNCKGILEANSYKKPGNWNISDYEKINKSSYLSEYEIQMSIWRGSHKILKPFEDWKTGKSLSWYQQYNSVKHDRNNNFKSANLKNVILAVSGVLTVLFSQFYILAFRSHPVSSIDIDDTWYLHENSIFAIKPPQNWVINECYDFNWDNLKSQPDKFDNYQF
ncbi:hypothetical protein [Nostoc sp.]|uniref:hypothetical protein n=1 Tax=Nostoc sp. TaxID=1180 RepID=UPI002FFD4B17